MEETQITQKPKVKDKYLGMDESMELLRAKVPAAYSEWIKLFNVNEEAYSETVVGNLSVLPTKELMDFNKWIKAFARGNLLDIGCGPQPLPVYLDGYPKDQIHGIDPIAEKDVHEFEFFNCVAEYLPYEDSQFDTVIIGTSLDHVLLLDQTLNEVHRVLKDRGRLIIYISFTKGAVKYNPYSENIIPIDKYHLFHFDKGWFEEVMSEQFDMRYCMQTENGHYFYCFDSKLL